MRADTKIKVAQRLADRARECLMTGNKPAYDKLMERSAKIITLVFGSREFVEILGKSK